MHVGSLAAKKGEKVQGFLLVPGTPVEVPVTIINGNKNGKTVLITGGTHGGEYPGAETAIRLAKELTPDDVSGALIIVHPLNVPAFFAKLQYIGPYDALNLNREYPGRATGTVTQRIAYEVSSKLFTQADFYMDLHGGDLHEDLTPFVFYSTAEATDEQIQIAKNAAIALGVKYVLPSASANGSMGCASAMGVPSILCEIGRCGLWSEAEVGQYVSGVKNILRLLKVLPGDAAPNNDYVLLKPMTGVSSEQTGCWYPSVKIGERVKAGQKIGEVRDFFSNVLGEYTAPVEGVALYVVSSLPVSSGEPLIAIGTEE
jgi:predicted deacylase